ncbi:calcium-binding protein [Sporichthya polymorpha]|uniref:calcium-binding protein n=1 Tax=Sporichthya polymorpha TaxID=35751 RepID=UPI000361EACF|nr:calcium-binding protein [Sporichthya polymorpha]
MDCLRPLPHARRLLRRLAIVAPLALLTTLTAPIPASAGVFSAAGNRCTVVGTSGDDVLKGTPGRDVICGLGGGGRDRVEGGGGTDRLDGGPGNDTVTGGNGGDLVLGGAGNDDLDGQSGRDTLDGGTGTNWCTVGATDTQKACVYDRTAPSADWITLSPSSVDVTAKDAEVTARMRIIDDTGVGSLNAVQLFAQDFRAPGAPGLRFRGAHLVSGTIRDGVWQALATVPRYWAAGNYSLELSLSDRIGRSAFASRPETLRVVDRNPDLQNPIVRSAGLNARSFDVRSKSASLTMTARVTDDLSGTADVTGCLYAPGDGVMLQMECQPLTRISGTSRDGTWRRTFTIPKGSLGGDWNFGVLTEDRVEAGSPDYWFGEDEYRSWTDQTMPGQPIEPRFHLLPNGRFAVLGTQETTAAWAKAMKIDRTSVDTLPGSQVVQLYVRAADVAGEGVTGVRAILRDLDPGSSSPMVYADEAKLHQGTRTDGWWLLKFVVPQGFPPGIYTVDLVTIQDKGHWRTYSPPAAAPTAMPSNLAFPVGSVQTTGGGAWDGRVTVIQNPAG